MAPIAASWLLFCLCATGAITGFSPNSGPPGTVVTVTGSGFTGATNFFFGGTNFADFEVLSGGTIMQAVVPVGANTGTLSVVADGTTSTSAGIFTVTPYLTGFSPTNGGYPTSVNIFGGNFVNGATTVTFQGASPVNAVITAPDQIVAVVPTNATDGPIMVTTPAGNAVTANIFYVSTTLAVTGFSPAFGTNGATITIFGFNFIQGVTTVSFNGLFSTNVAVVASSQLQAVVPAKATSGPITVFNANGSAVSVNDFITGNRPFIAGFTPVFGSATNTLVDIDGFNIGPGTVTGVKFGGISVATNNFTVWNANQIQVAVPGGASNAPIILLSGSGSFTTSSNFLSSSGPVITGFNPAVGPPGTTVTLDGFNFSKVKTVIFGTKSVSVTPPTDTEFTVNIPAGATNGAIEVSTGATNFTTASNFTVIAPGPIISSFSPAAGVQGMPVTLQGSFSNIVSPGGVKFNGVSASYTPLTAYNQLQTVVPAGATTGPISVINGSGVLGSNSALFYLQPWITNFSPTKAVANATITFSGRNLTGSSSLIVNGVAWNLTNVAGEVVATVPTNATTGQITLTTPGGIFIDTNVFAVLPNIYSFTPLLGPTNTLVTINGTSLFNVTNVQFNGVNAAPVFVTNNTVQVLVPPGATTGDITVFTKDGSSVSTNVFTVTQPSLLLLTKTASARVLTPGSNVVYTLTVTNEGPSIVTGLIITDPLPAGLSYVSATSTLGVCSNNSGVVTCNINVLTNNTGLTVTITAVDTSSGAVTNRASLSFAEGNLNPQDNSSSAQVYYLTTAQQLLSIAPLTASSQVLLSWPVAGVPFLLEYSAALGQTAIWQTNNTTPTITSGRNYVTNAAIGSATFFRLKAP